MKQTVVFVLLDQYADWESAILATTLQGRIQDKQSPYQVKTLSLRKEPIHSMGGFTTIPDFGIDDFSQEFAGLVLIGGLSWRTPEAKQLVPLLQQTVSQGKMLAAICDATVFLGMHGFLNEKKHTSNTLDDLVAGAQDAYIGSHLYQKVQAVRDGNLVTANGSAYLEFCSEVLYTLDAYPADYIESNYDFFRYGYIEMLKKMEQ